MRATRALALVAGACVAQAAPIVEIEVWSHLMGNSLNNGLGVHYGFNVSLPAGAKYSTQLPMPTGGGTGVISNLVSDGTSLFVAVNYQAAGNTTLLAYAADTGALRWSVPVTSATMNTSHVELLLTGTTGHVVVHTADAIVEGSRSRVTGYFVGNGSVAWAQQLPAVVTLGGGMVSIYNNVTGREYVIVSFETGITPNGSTLLLDVNRGGLQLPGPPLAPACGQLLEVPGANAFMCVCGNTSTGFATGNALCLFIVSFGGTGGGFQLWGPGPASLSPSVGRLPAGSMTMDPPWFNPPGVDYAPAIAVVPSEASHPELGAIVLASVYDAATGGEALYGFNISTGLVQFTRPWPWATTGAANPVVRIVARQPKSPKPYVNADTSFWAVTRSASLAPGGNYGLVGLFKSDGGALIAQAQTGSMVAGPSGLGFTPAARRTAAVAGLDADTLYIAASDLSVTTGGVPAFIAPVRYNAATGTISYAAASGNGLPRLPDGVTPFLAMATNGTLVVASAGGAIPGGVITCLTNVAASPSGTPGPSGGSASPTPTGTITTPTVTPTVPGPSAPGPNKAALAGGIVGGLLGAALVVGAAVWVVRARKEGGGGGSNSYERASALLPGDGGGRGGLPSFSTKGGTITQLSAAGGGYGATAASPLTGGGGSGPQRQVLASAREISSANIQLGGGAKFQTI